MPEGPTPYPPRPPRPPRVGQDPESWEGPDWCPQVFWLRRTHGTDSGSRVLFVAKRDGTNPPPTTSPTLSVSPPLSGRSEKDEDIMECVMERVEGVTWRAPSERSRVMPQTGPKILGLFGSTSVGRSSSLSSTYLTLPFFGSGAPLYCPGSWNTLLGVPTRSGSSLPWVYGTTFETDPLARQDEFRVGVGNGRHVYGTTFHICPYRLRMTSTWDFWTSSNPEKWISCAYE